MFPSSGHMRQAGLGGGQLELEDSPAHMNVGSVVIGAVALYTNYFLAGDCQAGVILKKDVQYKQP